MAVLGSAAIRTKPGPAALRPRLAPGLPFTRPNVSWSKKGCTSSHRIAKTATQRVFVYPVNGSGDTGDVWHVRGPRKQRATSPAAQGGARSW